MRILESNRGVRRLGFIVPLALILLVGCTTKYYLSPFDETIDGVIQRTCAPESQCEIRTADGTDFEWDEMFVFRSGLSSGDVKDILPAAEDFDGEFNAKIAFLRKGKLVKRYESPEIIEGEFIPNGTLYFIEKDPWDCLRFTTNSKFQVTPIKLSNGTGYQLTCSNCTESPIFKKFGG